MVDMTTFLIATSICQVIFNYENAHDASMREFKLFALSETNTLLK